MSKLSIEAFKASTAGAEEARRAAKEARARVEFEQSQRAFETRPENALVLAEVANLATCFDESFPSEISLASPNGYLTGLSVRRLGGSWRFGMEESQKWKLVGETARGTNVAGATLEAMGAGMSPELHSQLRKLAEFGSSDPVGRCREIIAALPEHVVAGATAAGSELLKAFGLPVDRHSAKMWVLECVGADVRLDLAATTRISSPPVTLASRGDVLFLDAMADAGLNLDRMPEAPAVMTPIRAAVYMGRKGAFDFLVGWGADITRCSPDAETLLHDAVESAQRDPQSATEIARSLIALGVDRSIRDRSGMTAHDHIQNYMAHLRDENGEEGDADLRELAEILDAAPAPRL